ncbi:MAG: nitroreductase family protein [Oscillospiraceae bacterium]|nr:nitroreductase family protein [Oscillospiraceae bacterium]
MNETLRTIAERYSCRAYEERLPEREKLEAIALAAVQSPSAMNNQPWKIVVITDKALIDEMDVYGMKSLAEAPDKTAYERFMGWGGKLFYNTPCMFLILTPGGAGVDHGIVSQNISLAAASLGLGSVICGMAGVPINGDNDFKKRIGFPDGWGYAIAVLVGYAKETKEPHLPDQSKIRFI